MDGDEAKFAELTTVNVNDFILMKLGIDDESVEEIMIEERYFFDDKFDLNNSLCVFNNSIQLEASSSACDIINQAVIRYLGDPSQLTSQKINFKQV